MKKDEFLKQYKKFLNSDGFRKLCGLSQPVVRQKGAELTDIDLEKFKEGSKHFADWLKKTIAEKRARA